MLAVAARPLATDDAWWHLAMGSLYAGGDLWPRSDPLLHTTVLRPPVPHEWLFQVVLHHVHAAAGFAGLRALHALGLAALLAGAFAAFRRASGDRVAAAGATVVFLCLAWFRLVQLRPELFSALAVLGLHWLALRPDAGPDRVRALGALGLLLLWVNAHSLFAIGLCLLLAALLGTALEGLLGRMLLGVRPTDALRRRARRLAGLALAGLAVTWLNPRGFAQHLTFVTESRAGLIWKIRDDFLAWNPLAPPLEAGAVFTPLAWTVVGVLFAGVGAVALWRLARLLRRPSPEALVGLDAVHLGLAAAAGVASLVAVRFHWLCLFPLLYLLRQWRAAGTPGAAPRVALALASVALAVATPRAANFQSFRSELAVEPDGYRGEWMDERYCGPSMRFLRDAGLEGRLYHPFNLGGFLGYWLAPRLRTFIDGRLDHVPAEVLDDYLAIRRASLTGPTSALRERLDRWGVDLFVADTFPPDWYDRRLSGTHLRRLPEWLHVHASRCGSVYLRRNPRNQANLERVLSHYAEWGVPFDRERGLRLDRVRDRAPEWLEAQRLRLPDQDALESLALSDDPTPRAFALDRLAAHAWRIGDFAAQIPLDRELLRLLPEAREPGVRLADALIQRGRPGAALPVLEVVLRAHPGDPEARYLAGRARRRLEALQEVRGRSGDS